MRSHLEYWPSPPRPNRGSLVKDLCALAAVFMMVAGIGAASLAALDHDLTVAARGDRL
ncbi:hypothetical protein [Aureimonas glaciei]|uniref:Uncharacterized protein n=1 Tax=Aureimonas glaciei TaxID=1776957 RepID=A0A916XYK2_9HYPH|nr:hypothetical protein [Aureimonas glaciei]GGD19858.1 hypothetical protein GCM10011335_23460 [Aureimonas glaciei]